MNGTFKVTIDINRNRPEYNSPCLCGYEVRNPVWTINGLEGVFRCGGNDEWAAQIGLFKSEEIVKLELVE